MLSTRKLCYRCRDYARDGKGFGVVLKGAQRRCRCEKGCDRLIDGICLDCGHYVAHP